MANSDSTTWSTSFIPKTCSHGYPEACLTVVLSFVAQLRRIQISHQSQSQWVSPVAQDWAGLPGGQYCCISVRACPLQTRESSWCLPSSAAEGLLGEGRVTDSWRTRTRWTSVFGKVAQGMVGFGSFYLAGRGLVTIHPEKGNCCCSSLFCLVVS